MADNTTQTNNQPVINEQAFIMAMESLSKRVEKTETDFLGHLQRVEDRLDQLVDLTKTVAVLQQQNAQYNDSLIELRTSLRDTTEKFQNSLSRLHARIDELQIIQRDKLETYSKETAISLKTNEGKIHNVDKELQMWLNRGFGAWAIFVLVAAAANVVAFRWIDAVDHDKTQIMQNVDKLSKEQSLIDQRLQTQEAISRESTATLKKLIDSERELEDIISHRSGNSK